MSNYEAKNTVQYMGEVDLSVERDGIIRHIKKFNKGLSGLSELFAYTCLGYSTANMLPYSVDLQDNAGQSLLYMPATIKAKYLETWCDATTNSNWKSPVFDFLIMSENIRTGNNATKLVLFSQNQTRLAELDLTAGVDLTGIEKNNVLIKWQLKLCNIEHGVTTNE